MKEIGDKLVKYWWISPAIVFLCQIIDIALMECARGRTVDYIVKYYPLPLILLLIGAFSAFVCIPTFLSALIRRKWIICIALAVGFVLSLWLLLYTIIHDPWGEW